MARFPLSLIAAGLLSILAPRASLAADISWLSLCPALPEPIPEGTGFAGLVHAADGTILHLSAATTRPASNDCIVRSLPVPAAAVHWAGPLPPGLELAEGVALVAEVVTDDPARPPSVLQVTRAWSAEAPSPLPHAAPNPPPRPAPPRAAWNWAPERWLADGGRALVNGAKAKGIGRIYLSLPIHEGRVSHPEGLAALLRRAQKAGISLWAVESLPHPLPPEERAPFVARARALDAFNAGQGDGPRLEGIQYMTESSLLPSHARSPIHRGAAWLDTVAMVRSVSERLRIDLMVPSWLAEEARTDALDRLAELVDGVSVTVHRTDPAAIQGAIAPWLAWSDRHGRSIAVVLESGSLPDMKRTTFTPAENGTLWEVSLGGAPVLVWLNRPLPNPDGRTFAAIGTQSLPAKAFTFRNAPGDLKKTAALLERNLSAWSGFAGIALHGLPD